METGYECTAYFKGIDGRGTCDTECQWWKEQGCVCAKGSVLWDGKEHYAEVEGKDSVSHREYVN